MEIAASHFAGIALAFLGGAALGALYFGGLWLTLRWRRGRLCTPPLLLASFLLRGALLLLGLWWLGRGQPLRMLSATAGILALRSYALRVLKARGATGAAPAPSQVDPRC